MTLTVVSLVAVVAAAGQELQFLLLLQGQRALGAVDQFAVAQVAVAVDRGVLHRDLLAVRLRVFLVVVRAWGIRGCSRRGPRCRGRRPKIGRLAAATTRSGCGCSLPPWYRAETKMLAASSWWLPSSAIMPGPGAVPQPPANQFLQGRAFVDDLAGGVFDALCPGSRASRPA